MNNENNKKKIVFVSQNLAPFRLQWLDQLSDYFDIEMFHLNDYHETVNKSYLSYKSQKIKINADYKKILGYKFHNNKRIINIKKDILILDGYGFAGQVFLIILLKILRKKFIISVDGGFVPEKEKFIRKILKKICFNATDTFLSTSEQTDLFIKHYCKKSPDIIRHYFSSLNLNDLYLPETNEKTAMKKKFGLEGKFVVIAVGRLVAYKSFDLIIEAMGMLDDDCCLIIVGNEPTDEYLEMIKNYPPGKVRFIGFKNKEELKEYYIASNVFVTASRGEIWGLVVGEAMSLGLPVISSNTCNAGISMIVNNENGYIVDDDNPATYAKRITDLKNNPESCVLFGKRNFDVIRKYTIEESTKNDFDNLQKYFYGV